VYKRLRRMQAAHISSEPPSPMETPRSEGPSSQHVTFAPGIPNSPSSPLGTRGGARPRSAVERARELADGVFEAPRAPVIIGDEWRMAVLELLIVSDCFFTASQAIRIVRSLEYSKPRATAVVRLYGRIVDDQRAVYECLTAYEKQLFSETMGGLKVFSSKNMTGKYLLSLAIGAHYSVASFLLQSYKVQLERGLCSWPLQVRLRAP